MRYFRRIFWGLACHLVVAGLVLAQDVITPEGLRIPLDSLEVYQGRLCLPGDTLHCYDHLPLASNWQFRVLWSEGYQNKQSDWWAQEAETIDASHQIGSSLLLDWSYQIPGSPWHWEPQTRLYLSRSDSLLDGGDGWSIQAKAGLSGSRNRWNFSLDGGVELSSDEDSTLMVQSYLSWMKTWGNSTTFIAWLQTSWQKSVWESESGLRGVVGNTWLYFGRGWGVEFSPSFQAFWPAETDSVLQSSARVFCDDLEASSPVCYQDSTGQIPQTYNPFKGLLGYAHPWEGPDLITTVPNHWWMGSFYLEVFKDLSSRWRLLGKMDVSYKRWLESHWYHNGDEGVAMPDSSGALALFQDVGSDRLFLLNPVSQTWTSLEQESMTRYDLGVYLALGLDFKMSQSSSLGGDLYLYRAGIHLDPAVGILDYLLLGFTLTWKGVW